MTVQIAQIPQYSTAYNYNAWPQQYDSSRSNVVYAYPYYMAGGGAQGGGDGKQQDKPGGGPKKKGRETDIKIEEDA